MKFSAENKNPLPEKWVFLVRVFITDSMDKLLTVVKHTLFQAIINN